MFWGKVAMTVMFIIFTAICTFFLSIFLLLTAVPYPDWMVTLVIVSAIGIVVFWTLGMFSKIAMKKLVITGSIYFGLCLAGFVGIQIYDSYIDSLEVVTKQDVNLNAYEPFKEGTKAIKLNEESTFEIEEQLPVLDGSTALYPIYASFAQAVYPKGDYPHYNSEVMSNQTSGAYRNLIDGRADMIFSIQPPESIQEIAESKGVKFEFTPIGREAFVFFVNADNPVDELSVDQIKAIYSGNITNWSEVGGEDESIRAFQRPEESGSQTTLREIMGEAPLMEAPSEDVVAGMGGIIERTTQYRNHGNAIGFSFRYFANEMVDAGKIKFLEINGVSPSKASIRDGSYPFMQELYAITAGSENPHLDRFIEWILSEQGQKIIDKTGYVPIKSVE